MRCAWFAVLLVGCGSPEGSVLTIQGGPDEVERLEVVLASPDVVEMVQGQRFAPDDATGTESVRYYRQRASVGTFYKVGKADGYTLRIEPDLTATDEEKFIPFVIAYDTASEVIGVGAVHDTAGEPTTILIQSGTTRGYDIVMATVQPMNPAATLADGQSYVGTCGDADARWTSGIAWRPGATQLRLLLADPHAETPGDATERTTDLDCDQFAAPDQDCDDLRPAFHVGHAEACDRVDSNCDGLRTSVRACSSDACGGAELCDDRTGEAVPNSCVPEAQCACLASAGTVCNRCTIAFKPAGTNLATPCAPSIGKIKLPQCEQLNPCTVEVLSVQGPWKVFVALAGGNSFSTRVTNVVAEVAVEVKNATTTVTGGDGAEVGTMYFQISHANFPPTLLPVDLRFSEPMSVCPAGPTVETFAMTCVP